PADQTVQTSESTREPDHVPSKELSPTKAPPGHQVSLEVTSPAGGETFSASGIPINWNMKSDQGYNLQFDLIGKNGEVIATQVVSGGGKIGNNSSFISTSGKGQKILQSHGPHQFTLRASVLAKGVPILVRQTPPFTLTSDK